MGELPAGLEGALIGLERTAFGDAVRTTPYLYPMLESVHILGIALLVGSVLAVDLRLLGVGRAAVRVTTASRHLLPLSYAGFVLVLVSGSCMFVAIALSAGSSSAAPWKLGLIALAGINILIFQTGVYRTVRDWDIGVWPPMRARVAGLVSAISWLGVIVSGRMLAYV